jgi:HEAT repeat protein
MAADAWRTERMTSANEKLVAYHIARLKDKSRDARLKAIAELVHLPHQEGLDALRQVVESDSDNDVRRAAQDAGREIYKQLMGKKT